MTGNVESGKVVVVVLDLATRHNLITRARKNIFNAIHRLGYWVQSALLWLSTWKGDIYSIGLQGLR